MAKGKHAAALFEVITKSRQFSGANPAPRGFSAPSWWFGRGKSVKQQVADAAPQTPVMQYTPVEPKPAPSVATAPKAAAAPSIPVIPQSAPSFQSAPLSQSVTAPQSATTPLAAAPTGPIPIPIVRFRGAASQSVPSRSQPSPTDQNARQPIVMALDPEKRQVSVHLSYSTAIISAVSAVAVITVAIVIGQHMSRGPAPLFSQVSTEALLRQPPHGEVLDVRSPATYRPEPRETGPAPHVAGLAEPPHFNEPRLPATLVTRDPQRTMGLNYVVIQSYPEEKLATDACKFLTQNGVPSTVERELRGWPKSAYIVVGIDGFARPSANEFKDYVARIERLSDQYGVAAHGQRSSKAFQPSGYKWDKAGHN